jgi:hypothetical protein
VSRPHNVIERLTGMNFSTLRRLLHAFVAAALLAVIVGWALTVDALRLALPPAIVRAVATAVLLLPMGLNLAFLVIQGIDGGRRIVPLRATRSPDAWILLFVLTMLPPKEQLASWVSGPLRAAETGLPISLVAAALAIAARVYQLNRGAALGVTGEAGPGLG